MLSMEKRKTQRVISLAVEERRSVVTQSFVIFFCEEFY